MVLQKCWGSVQRWLTSISPGNQIGPAGAEILAGLLGKCTALAHLNLSHNDIRAAGTESLAEVLAQCPALTHLNLVINLSYDDMGCRGAKSLVGVLGRGAESLAGVLFFCASWTDSSCFFSPRRG
jgi:hypothetical protein